MVLDNGDVRFDVLQQCGPKIAIGIDKGEQDQVSGRMNPMRSIRTNEGGATRDPFASAPAPDPQVLLSAVTSCRQWCLCVDAV